MPLVLLHLRNTVKEDTGCTPAQLLYGQSLHLPSDIIVGPTNQSGQTFKLTNPEHSSALNRLKLLMQKTRPAVERTSSKTFFPSTLKSATHVYIRIDTPRTTLQPRYSGPHLILDKINDQVFKVETNHGPDTISTSRLKPAIIATALLAKVKTMITNVGHHHGHPSTHGNWTFPTIKRGSKPKGHVSWAPCLVKFFKQ